MTPALDQFLRREAPHTTYPAGEWELRVVLQDTGMDSGCVHDILMECIEHAVVLEAYTRHENGVKNDLTHFLDGYENNGPKAGKC